MFSSTAALMYKVKPVQAVISPSHPLVVQGAVRSKSSTEALNPTGQQNNMFSSCCTREVTMLTEMNETVSFWLKQ